MARVIDAKYSTLIGTPAEIDALFRRLQKGASIVDLKFSNLVLVAKTDEAVIRRALRTTPERV
jgi:hypothetical protein